MLRKVQPLLARGAASPTLPRNDHAMASFLVRLGSVGPAVLIVTRVAVCPSWQTARFPPSPWIIAPSTWFRRPFGLTIAPHSSTQCISCATVYAPRTILGPDALLFSISLRLLYNIVGTTRAVAILSASCRKDYNSNPT